MTDWPAKTEGLIDKLVASGHFTSRDAVVDEAVRLLRDKLNSDSQSKRARFSARGWCEQFDAWAASHRPLPHEAADSRESIYDDRVGMGQLVATHIELRPNHDGRLRAFIAGTRVRVQDIFAQAEIHGRTPDEIVGNLPHLTLGQVHAALSYLFDHRAEILREAQEDQTFVNELKYCSEEREASSVSTAKR